MIFRLKQTDILAILVESITMHMKIFYKKTKQQQMFPPTHTHIYIICIDICIYIYLHPHIFVPTTMQSGEYDHAHTYICFHQQLAHHDIMRMVQGHHPQILNMFGGIQSAELDRIAVLDRIGNFHGGFHSHGGYPNSWMVYKGRNY